MEKNCRGGHGSKADRCAIVDDMKSIRKVKNVCAYSPRTCFVAPIIVSSVQCDVEKLPHAVVRRTLSRGKCRGNCGHCCAD